MEVQISTDDPFWQEMTPEEKSLESYIEEMFLVDSDMPIQPSWVKNHIIFNWLKHAHGIGDKTGDELFQHGVHAITYHKNAKEKPKIKNTNKRSK